MNMKSLKRWSMVFALLSLAAVVLAACGGGGGGDSPPPPTAKSISGTAAKGSPIANATITLKDAIGSSITATSDSDGSYTIDTTGLTAPFLLLVSTTTGSLYSVSADANANTVVNITPLTDLIIRSWYEVQGDSVDTAFADPATYPAPSPVEVQVISNVVQNMMQLWLNQAGVTTGDFNLISTPFSADGTGVDKVLDQASVDPATGSVLVSDGTTTQNSTLTALNSSVTVSTTTTGTGGTSTSNTTTVVPVQTSQQTALDGITTAINNFAGIVNAKGASLAASDLLPSLDPSLLNDGWNQNQLAAQLAGRLVEILAGHTVSFTIGSIKSLDTTNNVADVVFLAQSQGVQTEIMLNNEFFFKKVNGIWLISGNNRVASFELRALMRTSQGSRQSVDSPQIEANVFAPEGTVTGATVSGGGVWTNDALTQGPVEINPEGNRDEFDIYKPLLVSQLIPAGTSFTVAVTLSSGPTATYTEISNAFTTEAIMITNLTGTTIADATLGSPLTVNWTLPKTFAIAQVRIESVAYTGPGNDPSTFKCGTNGPVLGIAATTAQVTFPATCNGDPVLLAMVNVQVIGVNGEHEITEYQFGQ